MLPAAGSRAGDLFTFGLGLRSELMACGLSPWAPLGKLTRKLRLTEWTRCSFFCGDLTITDIKRCRVEIPETPHFPITYVWICCDSVIAAAVRSKQGVYGVLAALFGWRMQSFHREHVVDVRNAPLKALGCSSSDVTLRAEAPSFPRASVGGGVGLQNTLHTGWVLSGRALWNTAAVCTHGWC